MVVIFVGSEWIYMIIICFLLFLSFFNFVKCEVCLVGVSFVDGFSKIENGIVEIIVEMLVLLRFYGERFLWEIWIVFIFIVGKFNLICDGDCIRFFIFNENGLWEFRGEVEVILLFGGLFFVCL